MTRLRALLVGCLVCLHSPCALAVAAPAVDDYRALIARYRAGDHRGAVQALADQDDRWVSDTVNTVLRQADGWDEADAEAAALLHTEVVVGGWTLPQHADAHLAAARRFIELNRGHAVPQEFRRQWLLLVCWHFQSELEFGAIVPWLDDLRTVAPGDAELALAEGTFYETLVWNGAPPEDFVWNGRSKTLAAIGSRSSVHILERAAERFRVASASAITHDAAEAHLGRTLALLGRTSEARALLQPLTTTAVERRWRYLAALFLAQADTSAGRHEAAAAAYTLASTLMAGCQTAQVGLMTLRRLDGDAFGAADLAELLTKRVEGCDDPWWFYRFGQPPDRSPQLIAAMREPLLH